MRIKYLIKDASMYKSLLLVLFFITPGLHAAAENQRHEAWTFFMDNDMLSHDFCQGLGWCAENDDRAYTGGFGLGFKVNNFYSGSWTNLTRNVHRFLIGENASASNPEHNENYGFTAFTPDELDDPDRAANERPDPIFGDRPFASMWFYTSSLGVETTSGTGSRKATRSQFTLALLGTDIGHDLQHWIHCDKGGGSCPVEGWQNNINDGVDIAFSFGNSYISQLSTSENLKHEWIGDLGYNLGLYSELNAGITYRYGTLASSFYSFDTDPFSNANKLVGKPERDHYAWISIRTHFILYNGLLQGWHLFSDPGPVEYNSDEIEHLLWSASLGYTFPVYRKSTVTLKVQARTSEIKHELSKDHAWGGLYWSKAID